MSPKISKHRGLTDASVDTVHVRELLPAKAKAAPEERAVRTKEEPSPGNSSGTSPAKPTKSAEPKKASRPKPARTTASRSKSTAASGTARGATTNGPATDAED